MSRNPLKPRRPKAIPQGTEPVALSGFVTCAIEEQQHRLWQAIALLHAVDLAFDEHDPSKFELASALEGIRHLMEGIDQSLDSAVLIARARHLAAQEQP